MSDDDYADLRAAAEAATPGPWEVLAYDSGHSSRALNVSVVTVEHGDTICLANRTGGYDGPHAEEGLDAAYIATANPARILALLDDREDLLNRLERAEAALARVEALMESWPAGDNGQEYRRGVNQAQEAIRAALVGETEREGDAAPSGPADESAREDR